MRRLEVSAGHVRHDVPMTCLNVRMMNMTVRTPVIDGDDGLHAHDQIEAHDAAGDDQRRDDDHRHGLDAVAATPVQGLEDRRRREHGDDREDGLPADAEQPRDERRAVDCPERRRRRGSAPSSAPTRACRRSR